MAEEKQPSEEQVSNEEKSQQSEQPQQQLNIQKIYCKDVSFETPNSPQVFTQNIQPEMKTELNTQVNVLDEKGIFEVVLSVTVTAEYDNKTAFLAEVNQAGIFSIMGFEKANLDGILGSYCPNALFPYAREVVSELVSKGGFPQLVLQPVNFDAMYAQHLQSRQEAAASKNAETAEEGSEAIH
ncbi:MAG: protein-export chaperone SecB [Pseudomonadota bacterium]